MDAAGNKSAIVTHHVQVEAKQAEDKVAPTVSLSKAPATVGIGDIITVEYLVSDNIALKQITATFGDGNPQTNFHSTNFHSGTSQSGKFDFTAKKEGRLSIGVEN